MTERDYHLTGHIRLREAERALLKLHFGRLRLVRGDDPAAETAPDPGPEGQPPGAEESETR